MKSIVNIVGNIGKLITISMVLAFAPVIYGKEYDKEEEKEGSYNDDYTDNEYSLYYENEEYSAYQ